MEMHILNYLFGDNRQNNPNIIWKKDMFKFDIKIKEELR